MSDPITAGVTIKLIDLVADARALGGEKYVQTLNEMRPGGPVTEDWRWELVLPGGSEVTVSAFATATDVANYLKRERAEREATR